MLAIPAVIMSKSSYQHVRTKQLRSRSKAYVLMGFHKLVCESLDIAEQHSVDRLELETRVCSAEPAHLCNYFFTALAAAARNNHAGSIGR
jgi:hypothetical protein